MGRLIDRPDMTIDVYRGRKTTIQYNTIVRWGHFDLLMSVHLFDHPPILHALEYCFCVRNSFHTMRANGRCACGF